MNDYPHMDDLSCKWIHEFLTQRGKGERERDPPGRFGAVRLSDGGRRRQETGGEGEISRRRATERSREGRNSDEIFVRMFHICWMDFSFA